MMETGHRVKDLSHFSGPITDLFDRMPGPGDNSFKLTTKQIEHFHQFRSIFGMTNFFANQPSMVVLWPGIKTIPIGRAPSRWDTLLVGWRLKMPHWTMGVCNTSPAATNGIFCP